MRLFHDDADRTPRTFGSSVGRCKVCAATGVGLALLVLGVLVVLAWRYLH